MLSLLSYLARVTLVSGLLYGYYCAFLRNGAFHRYNRAFLLGASLAALILPLIDIPIPGLGSGAHPSAIAVIHRITTGDWGEAVIISGPTGFWQSFLDWKLVIGIIYIIGTFLFLTATALSLLYILRITRKYPSRRTGTIRLFFTDEPGTPFSFFRKIFWDRRLALNSEQGQQVFRHELYHVDQRHTLDILWLEGLRSLFWCNPFFHLIRREIRAIHEFLADSHVTSSKDQYAYAELLVWQAAGASRAGIAHPFFNTHLKRRIVMLTRLKKNRPGYLSRIMILPIVFLLFCAFSIKLGRLKVPAPAPAPLTVVIDAGHGGFDKGAVNAQGMEEKNIALEIAQKIDQLGRAYNVRILLTRDQDQMAGNKTSIRDGLEYRANFANEHKADIFVSIHINNGENNSSEPMGMQVWLSNKNPSYKKSVALGSAMIEELQKTYTTDASLKERDESIYVLRSTNMPAILLECGNINNTKDFAFISDAHGQEAIARSILQGILRYRETLSSALATLDGNDLAQTPPAAGNASTSLADVATAPSENDPATPPAPANDHLGAVTPATASRSADMIPTDQILPPAPVPSASGSGDVAPAGQPRPPASPVYDLKPVQAQTAIQQDEEPQYPGGQDNWIKYLIANAKYPKEAYDKNIQGRVMVRFRVGADGKVDDIKIVSPDPGYGMAEEAMRLIRESGKWIPSKKESGGVAAYKEQPIVFQLAAKK